MLQFKFGLMIHHLKYHKFHLQCQKLKHLLQYHPAEQCKSLGTSCITKRIVAKDTRVVWSCYYGLMILWREHQQNQVLKLIVQLMQWRFNLSKLWVCSRFGAPKTMVVLSPDQSGSVR